MLHIAHKIKAQLYAVSDLNFKALQILKKQQKDEQNNNSGGSTEPTG